MNQPKMLTITQTAKSTGLPATLIRALAKDEKCPKICVGSRVYINLERFLEWVNESSGPIKVDPYYSSKKRKRTEETV